MRLIFLRTAQSGQRQIGVVLYRDGRLVIDPAVAGYADELLRDVDRSDAAAVEAALRRAAQVYDGGYVRAIVEG